MTYYRVVNIREHGTFLEMKTSSLAEATRTFKDWKSTATTLSCFLCIGANGAMIESYIKDI